MAFLYGSCQAAQRVISSHRAAQIFSRRHCRRSWGVVDMARGPASTSGDPEPMAMGAAGLPL